MRQINATGFTTSFTATEIEAAMASILRREGMSEKIIPGTLQLSDDGTLFIVGVTKAAPAIASKGRSLPRLVKGTKKNAQSQLQEVSMVSARGLGRPKKSNTEAPKPATAGSNRGWPKGKPRGSRKPKEDRANAISLTGAATENRDESSAAAMNGDMLDAPSNIEPQLSPDVESQVSQNEEVA